jgi:hypothetical protein
MYQKFAATVVILVCVYVFTATASGKTWKGIVPLHSTRADVQKILGEPTQEDSGYEIDGDRVEINYSAQGCQDGLPGGWKVPTDTVVSISVLSTKETKLADVLGAGKKYDQIYAVHTPRVDYVDVQEGVRYTTDGDDLVREVTYLATDADDKKLRCGEYRYAAPVPSGAKNKFEQIPYDSYGKMPFEDAEGRLDSFLLELQTMNQDKPLYRGFILVYAGRSALASEAATIAQCSKNYLVSMRKADPETIIAADAGYRDEFKVELYIIPNDAYPPMLMPTVSPKKVEILPGSLSPCSK